MEKFKVTEHFRVYGNRRAGGSRYNCRHCQKAGKKWAGNSSETAKEHYESRHSGGTSQTKTTPNGHAQEFELTAEEAIPALNYLARRVVNLEDQVEDLKRRNGELLKALGDRHQQKVSDELRQVYKGS
jgi:hypothetical protein